VGIDLPLMMYGSLVLSNDMITARNYNGYEGIPSSLRVHLSRSNFN
jgi:hypothetical protein